MPHYLVDEFDPSEEFNVVVFVERAKAAMEKIYAAGHIPIIVGGTGFYIQALLYDIDFSEHEEKESYRKELEQLAKEKGKGAGRGTRKATGEAQKQNIKKAGI